MWKTGKTYPLGVTAMDTFRSPIASDNASVLFQSILCVAVFLSGLNPAGILRLGIHASHAHERKGLPGNMTGLPACMIRSISSGFGGVLRRRHVGGARSLKVRGYSNVNLNEGGRRAYLCNRSVELLLTPASSFCLEKVRRVCLSSERRLRHCARPADQNSRRRAAMYLAACWLTNPRLDRLG